MTWLEEFQKKEELRKREWDVEETPVSVVKGDLHYNTGFARLLCRRHDGLESTSLYIGENKHFFYVTRWNPIEYPYNLWNTVVKPITAEEACAYFEQANEKFVENIKDYIGYA